MRKKILVRCNTCGEEYLKDESEYKRNTKLGRKSYCSRTCVGKSNHSHLRNSSRTIKPIKKGDEYSSYRTHLRRIIRRYPDTDITLEYLKEMFDKQSGRCVYSNVLLVPAMSRGNNNPIYTMSVDRINSDVPYVKGNIQFISIAMNHMKGTMSHENVIELLKIIKSG